MAEPWHRAKTSWAPAACASLLLGCWHGLLLGLDLLEVVPSLELIAPVVGVGLIVGALTGLIAMPAIWMLRRLHSAWDRGAPAAATWPVALAWSALVAGWRLADRLFPDLEGLKVDSALASAPWTVPSVASMLTGRTSLAHRVWGGSSTPRPTCSGPRWTRNS